MSNDLNYYFFYSHNYIFLTFFFKKIKWNLNVLNYWMNILIFKKNLE